MSDIEKQAIRKALEHGAQSIHHPHCPAQKQNPCTCHVGKAQAALSIMDSHGYATAAEMRAELGANWVIARRTPRIVARYGEDVHCVTSNEYTAAERRAFIKRIAALDVASFI